MKKGVEEEGKRIEHKEEAKDEEGKEYKGREEIKE